MKCQPLQLSGKVSSYLPSSFMYAVWQLGMIPVQHTCGRAEDLIEDFIETGVVGWSSVQPSNDIAGLLDKYGGKIALIGGFDSNGPPALANASLKTIEDEVRRCFKEYGGNRLRIHGLSDHELP